mmetsp:Transcript_10591/g.9158  ORF Transcript_10591/g.9158 Transcript_10591/m.9158 type:complete len:113 (+) Transcript_10591:1205-1543(+)
MLNYLMIEKDLYPKIAEQSAKAIQGLNPKITVWNTGNDGKGTYDSFANIAKTIPPIIQTVEEQTGIGLPDWLVKRGKPSIDELVKEHPEFAQKLGKLEDLSKLKDQMASSSH